MKYDIFKINYSIINTYILIKNENKNYKINNFMKKGIIKCFIYCHYFTLNEHPKVNLAFPPCGLHKRVLHLNTLIEKIRIYKI